MAPKKRPPKKTCTLDDCSAPLYRGSLANHTAEVHSFFSVGVYYSEAIKQKARATRFLVMSRRDGFLALAIIPSINIGAGQDFVTSHSKPILKMQLTELWRTKVPLTSSRRIRLNLENTSDVTFFGHVKAVAEGSEIDGKADVLTGSTPCASKKDRIHCHENKVILDFGGWPCFWETSLQRNRWVRHYVQVLVH
ncbi:hypothetical protein CPB85DRAFT_1256017 [Mucidula mucida]|nr:hypothetical protein CPB85DRAFT_1256017 [Mucidula mucida]